MLPAQQVAKSNLIACSMMSYLGAGYPRVEPGMRNRCESQSQMDILLGTVVGAVPRYLLGPVTSAGVALNVPGDKYSELEPESKPPEPDHFYRCRNRGRSRQDILARSWSRSRSCFAFTRRSRRRSRPLKKEILISHSYPCGVWPASRLSQHTITESALIL